MMGLDKASEVETHVETKKPEDPLVGDDVEHVTGNGVNHRQSMDAVLHKPLNGVEQRSVRADADQRGEPYLCQIVRCKTTKKKKTTWFIRILTDAQHLII